MGIQGMSQRSLNCMCLVSTMYRSSPQQVSMSPLGTTRSPGWRKHQTGSSRFHWGMSGMSERLQPPTPLKTSPSHTVCTQSPWWPQTTPLWGIVSNLMMNCQKRTPQGHTCCSCWPRQTRTLLARTVCKPIRLSRSTSQRRTPCKPPPQQR